MFISNPEPDAGRVDMSTGSFPGLTQMVIQPIGATTNLRTAAPPIDESGGESPALPPGGGTRPPPPGGGTRPPPTTGPVVPPAPVPGARPPPTEPPVEVTPGRWGQPAATGTAPPVAIPGDPNLPPDAPRPPGPVVIPIDPGAPRPPPGVPGTGTRPPPVGPPPPPVGPPPPPRPSGSDGRPPATGTVGGGGTGGSGTQPPPGGTPGGGGTGGGSGSAGGGSGGGGTSVPPAGGGGGRVGGSSPGVTYTPHALGSGDLGVPGANTAGSFRNIQQFLATNAPAEAEFAQKNFVQPLANKALDVVSKEGNIPTQTQYDAARYPAQIPGVGAKPTALPAVSIPAIPAEPWFAAGPQAWAEWRAAEKLHQDAVARQKQQDADYAKATNEWEASARAAGSASQANMEGQKMGPQPAEIGKASDIGYQIGTGATPTGYNNFLANRGVSTGARKLDSYLYGATPGGAQQDIRGLQQDFGGLLGLVKNWTPYGAKIDPKTGLAQSGSVGGTAGSGTQPPGPGNTSGSTGWVPETGGDGSKQPHPDWIFNDETGGWMSPAAYKAWENIQRRTGGGRQVPLMAEPGPGDPGYIDPGTLLPPAPVVGPSPTPPRVGPPLPPGDTTLPILPIEQGIPTYGQGTYTPAGTGWTQPGDVIAPSQGVDGQTAPDGSKPGRVWSQALGSWVTPDKYIQGAENPDLANPIDFSSLYNQLGITPPAPVSTGGGFGDLLAQQNTYTAQQRRAARKDPNNWDEDGYYIGP